MEKNGSALAATRTIRERLADRVGHHTYDMWFGDTTTLDVEGSCVRVATDSRFVADWINGHFRRELDDAARETLGERASVDLEVAPERFGRQARDGGHQAAADDGDGTPPAGGHRAAPARRRGRGNAGPPDTLRRRLEDFVVGPSNELAYTEAVRLAEQAPGGSLLCVHGECGVGKTHLLQGIVRGLSERSRASARLGTSHAGAPARYLTAEQFTNDYITAVRSHTVDQFRKRLRKIKLLAIDDVHFLCNKVATQNEFLHTIDALDLAGARVALAADEHPLRLGFNRALGSRLGAGMVARIDPPDRATRLELARRLAASRGLKVSAPAIERLADRCPGSVRELEGCVNTLAALRLVSGGPAEAEVGLVLVEQVFRDVTRRPDRPLRMSTVIDVVCSRMVVSRAELLGSGRHRRVVAARGLVAHLARDLTKLSYPEIAQALGRKHHSTVHTAVGRLARHLREQRRVEVGDDGETLPVGQLVDRLRYEIVKAAGRG